MCSHSLCLGDFSSNLRVICCVASACSHSMALPKQILIPAGLGYGNSYYLRLRKKLKRTKLPMRRREYILSEYNIQRRNKPGNPKRWGKVRKLRVEHNYNGYRFDLCCTLSHRGSNRHTFYSRIVALTLLTTGFGIRGRPLKRLRRFIRRR